MSLLSSVGQLITRASSALYWSLENPAVPLTGHNISVAAGLTYTTQSGRPVSVWEALKWSPFYQGVKMICQDVGALPCKTYEHSENGREEALDHNVYRLLNGSVGETTSNLFLEAMIHSMLLYGNGYAYIRRRGDGTPIELSFINPWRVTQWRNMKSRRVFYRVVPVASMLDSYQRGGFYLDNVVPPTIRAKNILHFRSYTPNGLLGVPVVRMARDTIGRYLSAEQYEDDFFKNAMVPNGYFSTPTKMSPEAEMNFLRGVEKHHAGSGNRHRSMVLQQDMKWQGTTINPREAMLDAVIELGTIKAAQYLNIPAQLLQAKLEGSAYKSHTEITRRYWAMTLHPVMDRIERECCDKLFTDEEKDARAYSVQFDTDILLQSDVEQRMLSHRTLFELGALSSNEIRKIEGYNPREGGDEYVIPLNLGGQDQEEPQEGEEDERPPQQLEDDQERSDWKLIDLLQAEVLQGAERILKPLGAPKITREKMLGQLDQLDAKHRTVLLERILRVANVIVTSPEAAKLGSELLVSDILLGANEIFRSIHDESTGGDLPVKIRQGATLYREALKNTAKDHFFLMRKNDGH